MSRVNHWVWLGIPVLLFGIFAILSSIVDPAVASIFSENGSFPSPEQSGPFFHFLYDWGPFFVLITTFVLLGVFLLGFRFPLLKKYRRVSLLFILTYTLGSGLLVNEILKETWGRPRPKQVYEEKQQFHPLYAPNFTFGSEHKSFPCGHASAGFAFFAFATYGLFTGKRRVFTVGILTGFIFGGSLGLARMAQGGHFLSDVISAGVLMWIVAYFLAYWITKEPIHERNFS